MRMKLGILVLVVLAALVAGTSASTRSRPRFQALQWGRWGGVGRWGGAGRVGWGGYYNPYAYRPSYYYNPYSYYSGYYGYYPYMYEKGQKPVNLLNKTDVANANNNVSNNSAAGHSSSDIGIPAAEPSSNVTAVPIGEPSHTNGTLNNTSPDA
ncbi:Uncharacterized protein PBTT_07468 [Plasmodiophora brassicae]